MKREDIEILAERYQAKADRAYQNYQETGIKRYDRENCNNEDLASALRMAANSADDAQALSNLRVTLGSLASRAKRLMEHPYEEKSIKDYLMEVVAEARIRGLIRDD